MGEIISEVNYTEVIKKINNLLSKLTLAKKNKQEDEIDAVNQELNEYYQIIISDTETSEEAIKKHYNEVTYDLDNGVMGATPYLNASILREILQNIIDCDYKEPEIKIEINFDDNLKKISFKYNEKGFTISNLISFLSLDHTTKSVNSTGAFGLGAKGVILNAKCLEILSVYKDQNRGHRIELDISHVLNNGKKQLQIEKLNIFNDTEMPGILGEESYTKLALFLDDNIYKGIKKNLNDLQGECEKGKYITPIDLIFASLKQPNKKIFLKILANEYCIRYEEQEKQASFHLNNNLLATFKVYKGEQTEFSYLIPSTRGGEDMPKFIKDYNYNYFSTYELTGNLENENLPKFFINIPTIDKKFEFIDDQKYYITSDRKGIHQNKIKQVELNIARDFIQILEEFEEDLIIFIEKGTYRYVLGYLYEFMEHQLKINSENYDWKSIYKIFNEKIKINYKDNENQEKFLKLVELKNFIYESNLVKHAKELGENDYNFLFKQCESDFRTSLFDLSINFIFILSGKEIRYSLANYNGARMSSEKIFRCDDYLDSDHYNSMLIGRILYKLNYRNGNEILLLAAENDIAFTEETLIKLLQALIEDKKIPVEFNIEDSSLTVGEKSYNFNENFKISKIEVLYYANNLNLTENFFEFLCDFYKKHLFSNETELSTLKKIQIYKARGFKFSFNHNPKRTLKVSYPYRNCYLDIEKELSFEDIRYKEIVELTGLTDYKLLVRESIKDFEVIHNILELYDFDLDIVEEYSNSMDTINILSKISIVKTNLKLDDEHLIAFVKNGLFVEIIQFENYKNARNINDFDDIFIIPKLKTDGNPSKIKIASMASLLDKFLEADGKIKGFYSATKKPLLKMLDQFDYRLKPILDVNKPDVEVLKQFLKQINNDYTKKQQMKMYFAKDLTNKLYGYSTGCSMCDYQTDILNAFDLKEINYHNKENNYKVYLYMCANHYYESEGWLILNIKFQNSVGSYVIEFNEWLEHIKENEYISANLLKCEIQIVKKSRYQLFDLEESSGQENTKETYHFTLTPLLAVYWLTTNS